MSDIRHLEEASLAGLSALRTDHYDGWLLRFADGYSRRARRGADVAWLSTGRGDAGLHLQDRSRRGQRGTRGDPNETSIVEMGGRNVAPSKNSRVTEVSVRGYWNGYRDLMGI